MKLVGSHKSLYFIEMSEQEVDEIHNYVNLDDLDAEVFEGQNTLELETLVSIHAPMARLNHHNKTTFHIVDFLEAIINSKES